MVLPGVHVPALSAAILPPKPSGQLFCYKLLVLLHDAQTGKAGHATSEQVAPNAHGHRVKTHLTCSQPGGRIFILIMGPPHTLNQPRSCHFMLGSLPRPQSLTILTTSYSVEFVSTILKVSTPSLFYFWPYLTYW